MNASRWMVGSNILITSSSDGVVLVDRESGKALWWASVVNAHSAEMLPGGRIAVAAASHRDNQPGDRLIIFDSNEPGKELCDYPLFWGHGAVWDQ